MLRQLGAERAWPAAAGGDRRGALHLRGERRLSAELPASRWPRARAVGVPFLALIADRLAGRARRHRALALADRRRCCRCNRSTAKLFLRREPRLNGNDKETRRVLELLLPAPPSVRGRLSLAKSLSRSSLKGCASAALRWWCASTMAPARAARWRCPKVRGGWWSSSSRLARRTWSWRPTASDWASTSGTSSRSSRSAHPRSGSTATCSRWGAAGAEVPLASARCSARRAASRPMTAARTPTPLSASVASCSTTTVGGRCCARTLATTRPVAARKAAQRHGCGRAVAQRGRWAALLPLR